MRKYIITVVIATLIISAISCKDYLKVQSNSSFTETTSFSNLDFAAKAVNGIYANLANYWLYGVMHIWTSCDNDIEFATWINDAGDNSLAHYTADDGSTRVLNIWNTYYQTIERANICIDNLPVSPIWDGPQASQAHYLYGEAVTLRAMCYYDLIQYWGDVPFKTKSTQSGDQFNLPKTDRDSIYEHIVKDLFKVEDYVPWMAEVGTAERITKGFVKGLRARIALAYAGFSVRNKTFETRRGKNWLDYYKIANKECKEIMENGQHKLTPDFSNIFKTLHAYGQNTAYKENLFEIAFGRLYSGRYCYTIGMPFCTSPQDPKYGMSNPAVGTSPYYYFSFDTKDKRRNVSVEAYNYGNKNFLSKQVLNGTYIGNFSLCKWRKSWITPTMGGGQAGVLLTGVNFPVMRYADVVLMYAETENEINGPTQAAQDALALIRERAFPADQWSTKVFDYISFVSSSKQSFFNAIVDERAWEFGGELIRKYDLIRWNLLGAKVQQFRDGSLAIIDGDPKYSNVPTSVFWKYKDDGETLDILNSDYRLPNVDIPGYTRTSSWIVGNPYVRSSTVDIINNRIANGFKTAKNNYLYPIHKDIINTSNGVLNNDQWQMP
jgi:hypothetical protein